MVFPVTLPFFFFTLNIYEKNTLKSFILKELSSDFMTPFCNTGLCMDLFSKNFSITVLSYLNVADNTFHNECNLLVSIAFWFELAYVWVF